MQRCAVVLAATLAVACGDGAQRPTSPSVEVVGLEGIDAALAKHRGRGVLLNFWALWCAPCIAELPELMKVGDEFVEDGGRVVLVSYDLIIPDAELEDVRERVTEFAHKHGYDVPILIYDAPDYEAINARFDLPGGVPVTLALDKTGKVVDVQDGEAGEARFREMMQRALGR